jgi:hypothetical protein
MYGTTDLFLKLGLGLQRYAGIDAPSHDEQLSLPMMNPREVNPALFDHRKRR